MAAEVRKLAERSQKAAGEIDELAKSSVQVAERAGELIESIVPNVRKTADLVQEITAASNEQARGIEMVKNAIIELDNVIQNNASSSEEMSATAEKMSSSAEELVSQAQELSGLAMKLLESISFFKLNENELSKLENEAAKELKLMEISHARYGKDQPYLPTPENSFKAPVAVTRKYVN